MQNSIVIISKTFGNNSMNPDNLDFDIMKDHENIFEIGSVVKYFGPDLVELDIGDAYLAGEAYQTFKDLGLITHKDGKQTINSYCIQIKTKNSGLRRLCFTHKEQADEAALKLDEAIPFKIKFVEAFDENGNFIIKGFDPYRKPDNNVEYDTLWNSLFEDSGSLLESISDQDFVMFIATHNCHPFSDVVKLYYAQQHGSGTKGSYPAIYMWR